MSTTHLEIYIKNSRIFTGWFFSYSTTPFKVQKLFM